jgi:hypothetical protein
MKVPFRMKDEIPKSKGHLGKLIISNPGGLAIMAIGHKDG